MKFSQLLNPQEIASKVSHRISDHRAARKVNQSFRHVSGPSKVTISETDVALFMIGRNTEYYLPEFYRRHRALGVKHFVYVDNMSSDNSIEIAREFGDTTILTTDADFGRHQGLIRNLALKKVVVGGWRLALDADEVLDLPSDINSTLSEFLMPIDQKGYTGVVGQMLEMVPDGPISEHQEMSYEAALASFIFASIDNLDSWDYFDKGHPLHYFASKNRLDTDRVQFLFGGLRRSLFGEDCCLTKHPLFKPGANVKLSPNPHVTTGLVCAPLSVLIRHYKFTNNVAARESRLMTEGRIAHGEARQRASRLGSETGLSLMLPDMLKDPDITQLQEAGFLAAPPEGFS